MYQHRVMNLSKSFAIYLARDTEVLVVSSCKAKINPYVSQILAIFDVHGDVWRWRGLRQSSGPPGYSSASLSASSLNSPRVFERKLSHKDVALVFTSAANVTVNRQCVVLCCFTMVAGSPLQGGCGGRGPPFPARGRRLSATKTLSFVWHHYHRHAVSSRYNSHACSL